MTATHHAQAPTDIDELCVNTIRTLAMDAVQKANSGHPGTPMALAPIVHVLYTRIMRHSPEHPDWPDRDRFVLSAGHASMLLYAILYLTGYGLTLEDLKNFRQLGSPTAGHPEYRHAAGIEATTGPLGQGIAMCCGLALGERMLNARLGDQVIDHHTFTIASDGDMQEGISAEAGSLTGHLGLGRLVAFYDDNHISIEGDTDLAFSEDVGKRYEAYGWHVQNLGEDLALDRIEQATRDAMAVEDRPSLIVVRTHIAPGSPNKQDTEAAHGAPLGEEEVRLTKEAYGWPTDEPFHVPEEVLAHYRSVVERGKGLYREWEQRSGGWSGFELPEGWDADVPTFSPRDVPTVATRKAGGEVLKWAAGKVPHLVGGSADLAPSTLQVIPDGGSIRRGDYSGRNIHFGIREHAMGATVNGLVLSGFKAFGSGFLIFSDYMKASVRLASVMRIPSIFIYTHDSIGLGEDGPTHQPIEQLAMMRAQPNLNVVRPAGANETALAYRFALAQTETPTVIVLSRQGLPVWRPSAVPKTAIERGAYVLRESYKGRGEPPDLILVASGSEVHLCNSAAALLETEGVATRLVSMPCMDRFEAQDRAYRDRVLPPETRARVAVEALSPLGWHRWAGDAGEVIGMTTFGASAPAKDLMKHFGFTPERVAETGRAVVDRLKE
ncbi:MAG: transketolase [Solirubrobacteraceae bacterium]|nr:transketolase [Solirubrobacteraceae bacterium]